MVEMDMRYNMKTALLHLEFDTYTFRDEARKQQVNDDAKDEALLNLAEEEASGQLISYAELQEGIFHHFHDTLKITSQEDVERLLDRPDKVPAEKPWSLSRAFLALMEHRRTPTQAINKRVKPRHLYRSTISERGEHSAIDVHCKK